MHVLDCSFHIYLFMTKLVSYFCLCIIFHDLIAFLCKPYFAIVLQEAGTEGDKIQMHFEELLKSCTSVFVVRKIVSLPNAYSITRLAMVPF